MSGVSHETFKARINRLNGEIRVVTARVEALEATLKAERDVRKRLRQRLRMLSLHYSDKSHRERWQAGIAKFRADPERVAVQRAKLSKAMTTFLAELTPDQRRQYQKMVRSGQPRLVAFAAATR